MRTFEVPALKRVKVAGNPAKRMPVSVTIEVRTAPPGEPITGLIEVERGILPFVRSDRVELLLRASQTVEVGVVYASYAVFVTSERPVTLVVDARAALQRWVLLLAVAGSIMAAATIFLVTQ